jgi:hypothetical protein
MATFSWRETTPLSALQTFDSSTAFDLNVGDAFAASTTRTRTSAVQLLRSGIIPKKSRASARLLQLWPREADTITFQEG